jgi:PAS domain-containing protein
MILRLFRATVRPGAESEVLRRLRTETVPEILTFDGLHAFTSGFRHEAGRTEHLALSTWADLAAIEALSGSLEQSVVSTRQDDILENVRVDHFELVEPDDGAVVSLDGPVVGVVHAHVAPNADASAVEMIRASRPELARAGVLALHIGRRVSGHQTELAVLAVWRDRQSLHRFARARNGALIRPAFLDQTTSWSFETYDCLSPDRLMIPAAGPAVLLADDEGRYVDASPGVEAVLGIPGELILHRSVADLTAPNLRDRSPGLPSSATAGRAARTSCGCPMAETCRSPSGPPRTFPSRASTPASSRGRMIRRTRGRSRTSSRSPSRRPPARRPARPPPWCPPRASSGCSFLEAVAAAARARLG